MHFTFLQVSDVHLDSKLNSSRLSMPAGKRKERSAEIFQALEKAMLLARQRSVDVVLIPGDLWDSENVSMPTINRIIELFSEHNIPVIIAPGNHDYCGSDSFYRQHVLTSRSMRTWPEHVHIFQQSNFETFQLNDKVSVTGRAFSGNVNITERLLLSAVPKNDNSSINILLFHGSLDGYNGNDARWKGKITAPFSAAELEHLQFTYAAVGHYHDYTEILSSQGKLLGAYSGCLVGRGLDETGPRFGVIGTIELPILKVELERVEFDKRRVIKTNCDVTDLTTSEMMEKINICLQQSGARTTEDVVYLQITGSSPGGVSGIIDKLGPYYHLAIDDLTRPNYSLEKYDLRTTEGKFINVMLEMEKRARENSGILNDTEYGDKLSLEIIEDALYYGLDALKHKKVILRHVD